MAEWKRQLADRGLRLARTLGNRCPVRSRRRFPRLLALMALVVLLPRPAAGEGTLVVASKSFTESRVLAEVMAQLIEAHTDLRVQRRHSLGGTLVLFTALRSQEIDLYPEYTGTAWAVMLERTEAVTDPLRVYLEVARECERRFGVLWLTPFGFSNSYALALREEVAEELGITRISDLQAHGSSLRAGWSHEFLERGDGFPGLVAAYGLELAEVRGMEHGLAYEALASGHIDLTDAYSTDGKLRRFPVRVLEDDRRYFPPYEAAPVVRQEALQRFPELQPLLERLAFRISAERMQQLNDLVEGEGLEHAEAARRFLQEEGLLGNAAREADSAVLPPQGSAGSRRVRQIAGLTAQHLGLVSMAMLAAVLVAVPAGIALARRPGPAGVVLGAAGVIQTIPSLALLACLIPILGLGAKAAVVALFLYALLPILRNTVTGLQELDPDLLDAAKAMGLTPWQVLRRVELPLALGTVMAGVRTSAVLSVGVATLAAFIGAGGLGEPIITGLQLNDVALVLSGALPAAVLALVTDGALGWLQRRLTPRGLQ